MHETVHRQVLLLTLLAQSDISWDPSILIYVAKGHLFSLIRSISIIRLYHNFVIHYTFDGHLGFISKGFFDGGGLCFMAGEILIPPPGIKPVTAAVNMKSLKHWDISKSHPFKNFKSSYKQCCYGYFKICLLAHLHQSFFRVYTRGWRS